MIKPLSFFFFALSIVSIFICDNFNTKDVVSEHYVYSGCFVQTDACKMHATVTLSDGLVIMYKSRALLCKPFVLCRKHAEHPVY